MLFFKVVSAIAVIALGIYFKHSFYKKFDKMRESDENENKTTSKTIAVAGVVMCCLAIIYIIVKFLITGSLK